MSLSTIDLITVLGPTASGKTQFAVQLALRLDAEIISADSRQVYRGMDLGTGKDINEYTFKGQQVPYHLVDIVDAGYKYNVFEYQNDFLNVYATLKEKSILPILCGGSGMYIEAVLKGYKLVNVPVNEVIRAELELLSLPELTEKLATFKKMHNRTDVDTKKRAIRAIEIAEFTEMNGDIELEYPKLNSLILGINLERELVRNKITSRLKQRLREGMIEEVEALIMDGVPTETLVYYGLEYKYITQFLSKELSYNAMVEKLNIAIHQFSRRQMTWFRKMDREGFNIQWIDGSLPMDEKLGVAMKLVQGFSK
jgi:tRNA dimethylallyltransferase